MIPKIKVLNLCIKYISIIKIISKVNLIFNTLFYNLPTSAVGKRKEFAIPLSRLGVLLKREARRIYSTSWAMTKVKTMRLPTCHAFTKGEHCIMPRKIIFPLLGLDLEWSGWA